MSIIDFCSDTWSDPWVESLPSNAKLLFIYLWTNPNRNLPCLYQITYKRMSEDTGINRQDIENTLLLLYPKVVYDEESNLVFVVNFVRRQFLRTGFVSPKIIVGIERALALLPRSHQFISLFLDTYKDVSIRYPYPLIGYSYPIDKVQVGVRVRVKGEGEGKEVEKEKGAGKGKGRRKGNAEIEYSENFLEFWKSYPKRSKKPEAFKAWVKNKCDEVADKIESALQWQRTSLDWTKDDGQFIPLPASYLNAHRWEDEPVTAIGAAGIPLSRLGKHGQEAVVRGQEWLESRRHREAKEDA